MIDLKWKSQFQELLLENSTSRFLPGGYLPRAVAPFNIPGKANTLIGIRRGGKTTLLHQWMQRMQNFPRRASLFCSFDDDRLIGLRAQDLDSLLHAFAEAHPEFKPETELDLYLDEIQNADGWASVVRRFLDTKNVELFLTGS